MLSSFPDSQRTTQVLNNINTLIQRFDQLRTQYSQFDEYGNVESKLVYQSNYKPLMKYFDEFKINLYWILPVVENTKYIYVNPADQMEYLLKPITNKIDLYKSNTYPSEQNKYSQLYTELNNYFSPFESNTIGKKEFLISKHVNTNINCIANNSGLMCSPVFYKDDEYGEKKFLVERYNLGLEKMELKEDTNTLIRAPLTEADVMCLSSFITLPKPAIYFSKVNMPNTYILEKAHLNQNFLNYWELLKKNTKIKNIFSENENDKIMYNKDNFANNIKNYTLEKSDISDKEYNDYVNNIIPKTRVIFELMKDTIKGKLSIVDVVSHLEPFLIYTENITYNQYLDITEFINSEISIYNTKLIDRSKLFSRIRNKTSEPVIKTSAYPIIFNIKNLTYQEEVFYAYGIDINDSNILYVSNSEILKKIIVVDNNRLYSSLIANQTLPLMLSSEFNDLYSEDTEQKQDGDSSCDVLNIAKSYDKIEDIKKDNNVTIYYDKKYDKTDYSILDAYESQLINMTPESFAEFLSSEIQKKYKLSSNESIKLVETILSGHKKVENGDYAFIIMPTSGNEDKVDFYIRKQNSWVLDKNVSNEMTNADKNVSCNLKLKCIAENNKCESITNNMAELKEKLMKNITSEFDMNYHKIQGNLKQIIKDEVATNLSRIDTLRHLELLNLLRYNDQKYNMISGVSDNTSEQIQSPNSKLLYLILQQGDFIKVQHDIIKFVQKFTRDPIKDELGPLNKKESPAWLYCRESNTPLLPIFKYTLATEFVTNQYNYKTKLEILISQIGKLSDDGNSWIDENSGWTITKIEDDIDEGYEDGFKAISRSIIEDDVGNKINLVNTDIYVTDESRMINNIVNTIASAMGINLEGQKEFIINSVSDSIKMTVETESDYKMKIKEMAEKNKRIMSYNDLINSSLLYYTLGMILISIQTAIPSIKSRKTYPGCVRSFHGFPFEGVGDYSSLEYLTCIISDIKHSGEPWYVLKGKKNEVVFKKIKLTIENVLLNLSDVKTRFAEKTEYLILNKEEEIPEEHDVIKWSQFLPPLVPFKITNMSNITSEFKNKLLSELKNGSKSQTDKILVIQGKIIKFALAIQENIYEVVKKEGLLMVKQNQEPFLENSCCPTNDTEGAIQYFIKKKPEIGKYNTDVINLSNYLTDILSYSKATILCSSVNTKSVYTEVTNKFSEEIIYLSFINFCKFKSLQSIPDNLLPLCTNKPDNLFLSGNETLEDMIIKLKQDGRHYNTESFLRLIQLVSREHIHYYDIDKALVTPITKLTGFLEMLNDTNDETIEPSFRKLLEDNIDTFEIGSSQLNPQTKNLNNYLQRSNNAMKEEIKTFIAKNTSNAITKSMLTKILNCLNDISSWKSITDNAETMSQDMLYNIANFYKNYIEKFTCVFPSIIKNNVDFEHTPIPKYQGLSMFHSNKISNIISEYYKQLKKFYGNPYLEKLLHQISIVGKNLVELSKITPILSNLKNGEEIVYPVLNQRTGIYMLEFYLLKSLDLFIGLSENKDMIVYDVEHKTSGIDLFTSEYVEDINRKDEWYEPSQVTDTVLINGTQKKLKERVADLLSIFISIFCEHKKIINYTYSDIRNNIFKLKEKEKSIITDRLQFISDEEREIDTVLKINKLGVWNKGLQKGLTQYSKENYDDDRVFRSQMNEIEAHVRKENETTDRNIDILIDEYIEQRESSNLIENEEYDMTSLNEEYYNDFEEDD